MRRFCTKLETGNVLIWMQHIRAAPWRLHSFFFYKRICRSLCVPCTDDVVLWICLQLDQVCRRGSRLECFEDIGIFSSVSAVMSWTESKDMCNKHCYVSQAPRAPKQKRTLPFSHSVFELVNILFWGFFCCTTFRNARRTHCVYMWRQ